MRLWTFHPKYLAARGLTALWREGLLAQHVLSGRTRGYINHPQLDRFKSTDDPISCINKCLHVVYEESQERGYHFDISKLGKAGECLAIKTTKGQLLFEWAHFKKKVRLRNIIDSKEIEKIAWADANPIFRIVDGLKEEWEKQW